MLGACSRCYGCFQACCTCGDLPGKQHGLAAVWGRERGGRQLGDRLGAQVSCASGHAAGAGTLRIHLSTVDGNWD